MIQWAFPSTICWNKSFGSLFYPVREENNIFSLFLTLLSSNLVSWTSLVACIPWQGSRCLEYVWGPTLSKHSCTEDEFYSAVSRNGHCLLSFILYFAVDCISSLDGLTLTWFVRGGWTWPSAAGALGCGGADSAPRLRQYLMGRRDEKTSFLWSEIVPCEENRCFLSCRVYSVFHMGPFQPKAFYDSDYVRSKAQFSLFKLTHKKALCEIPFLVSGQVFWCSNEDIVHISP